MDNVLEILRAFGARLAVIGLVLATVAWLVSLALPRLALATTCFVATPGGLVLVVLIWRYLGRRRK